MVKLSNPELAKLNEIAVKVGRVEATQDAQAQAIDRLTGSIEKLIDKMDKSDDIAKEALQLAESAHKRIKETNEAIKDIRSGQRWLIGTTISVLGLFIAAVGFLWKLSGQ